MEVTMVSIEGFSKAKYTAGELGSALMIKFFNSFIFLWNYKFESDHAGGDGNRLPFVFRGFFRSFLLFGVVGLQ